MPLKELSELELDTYSRQITLNEIGYQGQISLRNATVCVIGIGGLGAPSALKLTAMGIGTLRLIDQDVVARSDLHRQYLYDVESLGLPKVEVAYNKLSKLNPGVEIQPYAMAFNSSNVETLLDGVDVVIDGLDRIEPRYLLNRACHKHGIPYIFGSAIESYGNVSTIIPGKTACLECFYHGIKNEDLPKCAIVGVHPSVLALVSAVQVSEAVHLITRTEPTLTGKLLYIDLRELSFDKLEVSPRKDCPVCSEQPAELPPLVERSYEEVCGRDGKAVVIMKPSKILELDLKKLHSALISQGKKVTTSSRYGLTFRYDDDVTLSLLRSGTLIAQVQPKAVKPDLRNRLYEIYKSMVVDVLGVEKDALPKI